MIPYCSPKRSDLYTLCWDKLLENHTLDSGTYLYSPYIEYPGPPGSDGVHLNSRGQYRLNRITSRKFVYLDQILVITNVLQVWMFLSRPDKFWPKRTKLETHRGQNLSRIKTGQNRLNKQNFVYHAIKTDSAQSSSNKCKNYLLQITAHELFEYYLKLFSVVNFCR